MAATRPLRCFDISDVQVFKMKLDVRFSIDMTGRCREGVMTNAAAEKV